MAYSNPRMGGDSSSPPPRTLAPYLKTPAALPRGNAFPDGDVVISSRARLARNLVGFPFPHQASSLELRRVAHQIKRAAREGGFPVHDLVTVGLSQLSLRDLADLVNARRISPDLAHGPLANRFALLDENGSLSAFIGEEDHLRLQAVVPGNAPGDALRAVQEADACFARRLFYARDTLQWGYLTASLGNVGTGLRLSLLLHLPSLQFMGRLNDALRAAHVLGISVRASHGEHSAPAGDLFQVSNAVTWGLTTSHIAGRVQPVADYLVAAERAARREVAEAFAEKAIARAQTAWETVEKAERLSGEEALDALSHLRLCSACGLARGAGQAVGPDERVFAHLLADLRTGATANAPSHEAQAMESRDAIARPAKLRRVLRPFLPR